VILGFRADRRDRQEPPMLYLALGISAPSHCAQSIPPSGIVKTAPMDTRLKEAARRSSLPPIDSTDGVGPASESTLDPIGGGEFYKTGRPDS